MNNDDKPSHLQVVQGEPETPKEAETADHSAMDAVILLMSARETWGAGNPLLERLPEDTVALMPLRAHVHAATPVEVVHGFYDTEQFSIGFDLAQGAIFVTLGNDPIRYKLAFNDLVMPAIARKQEEIGRFLTVLRQDKDGPKKPPRKPRRIR